MYIMYVPSDDLKTLVMAVASSLILFLLRTKNPLTLYLQTIDVIKLDEQ